MLGFSRTGATVVALAVLAGCNAADKAPAAAPVSPVTTTVATGAQMPSWLHTERPLTAGPSFEGQEVWLDQDKRMVYIKSCASATAATREGAPYGPSPRDADGNYVDGYGYACLD